MAFPEDGSFVATTPFRSDTLALPKSVSFRPLTPGTPTSISNQREGRLPSYQAAQALSDARAHESAVHLLQIRWVIVCGEFMESGILDCLLRFELGCHFGLLWQSIATQVGHVN